MRCNKCGAQVAHGTVFCPECGAAVMLDADKTDADGNFVYKEDQEPTDYKPYGATEGETHSYETDGYVWIIYINGATTETEVDSIELKNGATCTFKVETL